MPPTLPSPPSGGPESDIENASARYNDGAPGPGTGFVDELRSTSTRIRTMPLVTRLFSWASALGVVTLVALLYDRLPELLPVTRWSSAPRSLLLALRVPSINLMSLVLIEALSRALLRSSPQADAQGVATALFLTIGMKALIEGAELFLLPTRSPLIPWALVAAVVGGVGVAVARGRRIFLGPARQTIHFDRVEKLVAAFAIASLVALQLAPAF
ncbi:hypothetical protein [Sorangium cellulosum]|nr:hypothetical protein [Sorangium cellulosum]